MSPIYDYRCPCGKEVTRLRKWVIRDAPITCECGEPMGRLFPRPHCLPDGVYSYAPNIGSAENFERKQAILDRNHERKKDGLKYQGGTDR